MTNSESLLHELDTHLKFLFYEDCFDIVWIRKLINSKEITKEQIINQFTETFLSVLNEN